MMLTTSVLFEVRATAHAAKYHAREEIRFVSGGKCKHTVGYEERWTDPLGVSMFRPWERLVLLG